MPMFRKKPIEIEGRKVPARDGFASDGEYVDYCTALAEWCGGLYDAVGACVVIPTLEGNMRALVGDTIMRGPVGEFYPVKPDALELTFDEVG